MSSILNSQIIKLRKPKIKWRWKVWPNHLFLYEFVSFILRYLSKMQNRTLKHNGSLFPPRSLTAMQCHTDRKNWHKLIFNQNRQRLTRNLVSNNCQIKWNIQDQNIYTTDKRTEDKHNRHAISVSCLEGNGAQYIHHYYLKMTWEKLKSVQQKNLISSWR